MLRNIAEATTAHQEGGEWDRERQTDRGISMAGRARMRLRMRMRIMAGMWMEEEWIAHHAHWCQVILWRMESRTERQGLASTSHFCCFQHSLFLSHDVFPFHINGDAFEHMRRIDTRVTALDMGLHVKRK